ncbi:MAG: hypothetical protein IJN55_04760 [Alistipes sp.]|nr:hypothetical protein [Alistipes sp.]
MNIKNYLIVATVLLAAACTNSTAKNEHTAEKQPIPAGAVEMQYNKHLYFQVMLRDSIPARMIFDTGSNNLLIDSTFYASTFGEGKNLRRAMLGGAGDGYELTTLDASGWRYSVGEESYTESMAIVMNLRKILGDGVDGLFGTPFMQGKRVEFNYADGYMRFLAEDEKIGEDFTAIQCKRLDNIERIIIPLSVIFNDGYTLDGNFLMDTGMPNELSLNSATANRLKTEGHLANARRMRYEVGGIGGSRVDNYLNTKQISIGGKSINDIRITYSENEQGSLADSRYDGLVGNALFARFDVIFDFVNWVIYLRPNQNFDKPQPNNFGIGFTPNGDHWTVNALLEGGNAERAGLRQGDRIETINGIKATDDQSSLYPLPDQLTLSVQRDNTLVEIVVNKE